MQIILSVLSIECKIGKKLDIPLLCRRVELIHGAFDHSVKIGLLGVKLYMSTQLESLTESIVKFVLTVSRYRWENKPLLNPPDSL